MTIIMGEESEERVATVKNPKPRDRYTERDADAVWWLDTRCHRNLQPRVTTPRKKAPHAHPRLRTSHKISQDPGASVRNQETRLNPDKANTSPKRGETMKNRWNRSLFRTPRAKQTSGRNLRSEKNVGELQRSEQTWERIYAGSSTFLYADLVPTCCRHRGGGGNPWIDKNGGTKV